MVLRPIVNMELLLSVFIIVSSMLLAFAQGPAWEGRGEERGPSFGGSEGEDRFSGPRGFGGPGRHRGPGGPPGHKMPMIMIPMYSECQNFTSVMTEKFKEMWTNKEIGPGQCEGDHHDCMLKDMEKVRCRVQATPTKECVEKLRAFMQGDTCLNDGEGKDEDNEP
ncbi:uncharacterized protein [Parasteatoda tepidariorum]|uniref:uncharacterized protein n=1 Tax=Parasteatoda tepidariorum TaxID=114398 RepID=UPI00077FB587|nr:uncharacterized protein LOC107444270 [Parasteatoda tepidariorum]